MSDEIERLRTLNAQLANQIVGMSDRLQASVREIQAKMLRDVADGEPHWLWNIVCGETCVKGIERVDHDAIADKVRDALRTRADELEFGS